MSQLSVMESWQAKTSSGDSDLIEFLVSLHIEVSFWIMIFFYKFLDYDDGVIKDIIYLQFIWFCYIL